MCPFLSGLAPCVQTSPELLLKETELEAEADDTAVGLRGLRVWTELATGEDWSAYYPEDLGNRESSNR